MSCYAWRGPRATAPLDGVIGDGVELLLEAPLNGAKLSDNGLVDESGVVTLALPGNGGGEVEQFAEACAEARAAHRQFDRNVAVVPADE